MSEASGTYNFLNGPGELRRLIRAFDWTRTALGPIPNWPASLKTIVGLLLGSPAPMAVLWGEDGVLLYNDAYSVFAGARHPQVLGSKVIEGWPEAAELSAQALRVVLEGGSLQFKELEVSLNRTGSFEPVWLDLDYSPVLDETGKPAGVMTIIVDATERVLTERRDRAERENLAQMFEQAPGFICTMRGPEHVFEFMNAAHRRLFHREELVGKPVKEAFPDIEGQGFYEALDRAYSGERVVFEGAPVRLRPDLDGPEEQVLLDFIYAPMCDAHGRIVGVFCEGYDVSDRARAQEALAESEGRLRILDQISLETTSSVDAEDILRATTRIVGERLDVAICAYASVELDQDNFTVLGEWRATGTPSILGPHKLADFGSTARTAMRAGAPLVINDRDGDLPADETSGFKTLGVKATLCLPLIKEGRLTAMIAVHTVEPREWRDGDQALLVEVADRSWAHVERARANTQLRATANALSNLNATLEQRVVERTGQLSEAQDALHQAQKMEAVGQLTSGMAHDFNNLLAPIVGALELLRLRLPDDAKVQRLTDGALSAADRAKTLVQRLLAFSRRQHLAPQPVDVAALMTGMRDLFAKSLGPTVHLNLEIAECVPPALVDPNQLELAILNLVVNARDAMNSDGELVIGVGSDAYRPDTQAPGEYVKISVRDNGVGMDERTLQRATEPFFSTKGTGRGSGLGLSSIQGLAAQSGGVFRLESRLGEGTTAVLWLLAAKGSDAEAVHATQSEKPLLAPFASYAARNARVLLVDDEEGVRTSTATLLTEAGYLVSEAVSASHALRMIGAGTWPDIVVTDYAMPEITGAQLAAELKLIAPTVPVLLITGYASLKGDDSVGLERLAKPFRQSELVNAIERLLGR